MPLTAIEFHASEDADLCCAACGRSVKRAATLSDGRMLGLDCAASAMGRPRSRSTYADIEIEAGRAAGLRAGAEYDARNPKPRAWFERQAWGAAKAAASPFGGKGIAHVAYMG